MTRARARARAFFARARLVFAAQVNRELEDPFLYEPNELPLAVLHSEFNQRLVSLQPLTRGRRWGALEGTPGHAAVSDAQWRQCLRNVNAIKDDAAVLRKAGRAAVHARLELHHVRADGGFDGSNGAPPPPADDDDDDDEVEMQTPRAARAALQRQPGTDDPNPGVLRAASGCFGGDFDAV